MRYADPELEKYYRTPSRKVSSDLAEIVGYWYDSQADVTRVKVRTAKFVAGMFVDGRRSAQEALRILTPAIEHRYCSA